jgi:Fe-S oxidoreductase
MAAENKLAVDTPEFWDEEALLKDELRHFDVCHGCRLCWNFCPAFPELFDRTDAVDGDLSKLTRSDLRPVEDLCYQCKLCFIRCPYTDPHDYDLDVPRLFMRAKFVNTKKEGVKWQDRLMGDTDLLGKLGGISAPIANPANNARPIRLVLEKTLGVHRDATLPKFHTRKFKSWFRGNAETLNARVTQDARKVALFYTCYVNYNDPSVGVACAEVLSHNNVRVVVAEQQCCGMPFVDGGALELARKKIRSNIASHVDLVRQGYDIVVPGPTCSYMIKRDYPLLETTEEAKLVAEHTFDISEYLWKLKLDGTLKTDFSPVGKVAYHAPCHTRAQFMGNKGASLLELIPYTEVEQIERCSAHDGTWGVKTASHLVSLKYGEKLFKDLLESDAGVFVSDCPLAATQIEHGVGTRPVHPMQVLKTAYGI